MSKKTPCRFCQFPIADDARKCWRCGEFQDEGSEIDDRQYRIAKRAVMDDVKMELADWGKRAIMFSGLGIVCLIIGSCHNIQATIKSTIQSNTGSQLLEMTRFAEQTKIQVENSNQLLVDSEKSLKQVKSTSSNLESQFGDLDENVRLIAKEKKDVLAALRSSKAQLLAYQTQQIDRVYDQHESLRRELAFLQMQLRADSDDLSDVQSIIKLANPISFNPKKPLTVFSNEVRLEWADEGHEFNSTIYEVDVRLTPSDHSPPTKYKSVVAGTMLTLRFQNEGSNKSIEEYEPVLELKHPGQIEWSVSVKDPEGNVVAASPTAKFEIYPDAYARIESTKEVRIGVSASYTGKFLRIEKNGSLAGFDADLARRIAERLNARPRFYGFVWEKLLGSPASHEVDFIISTITIKPDRETEYDMKFSSPYFRTHQAFVVRSNSNIESIDDIHNKSFVVRRETTSVDVALTFTERAKITREPNAPSAFNSLMAGNSEVWVADEYHAFWEAQKYGRLNEIRITPIQPNDFPETYVGVREEDYGVAVAANQTRLLTHINSTISEADQAGYLNELAEYHLGKQLANSE